MIKKKPVKKYIEIDLTGPQGNAFVLLGMATKFLRQMHHEEHEIEAVIQDMQSSNYEHLVETFDKHFGDFVVLYR